MNYIIGIDEVGRGPIAGPVVVCACAVRSDIDALDFFPKRILKDSKKLSEKIRKEIVGRIEAFVSEKKIIYALGEVDAITIDRVGIVPAINEAMNQALLKIHENGVSQESYLFLDGSLKAPSLWVNQETVIKGDEKIVEISLASIIAKVYRDTYMEKLGKECDGYGFEKHAGYGTKFHYEAIAKNGLTEYHRKSFLKKLL